jgi:hypothetical protein
MGVALVAAYALAFQLLLTGFAAAQITDASGTDAFEICYGATTGDQHKPGFPAAHQTCVLCSVAAAASLPPPSAAPTVLRFAQAMEFRGRADQVVSVSRRQSPRSSQGPPRFA